ncbi:MAG TPA: serine hydrolase [Myxococcaceae bacterium]|nr:serine hydrolase [Myxococcaceae bacterium]
MTPSLPVVWLCIIAVSASAAPKGSAPAKAQPAAALFEPSVKPEGFLPRATPAQVGLRPDKLAALIAEAQAAGSDSLVILKNGKVVVERYFGQEVGLIELMSATKGIVALAVGLLLADKKIPSLDTPLSTYYPEWRGGQKGQVTLRHVLTNTSGLQNATSTVALTSQPDRLKHVRALPIVETPGKKFAYNNEAVQLLSGVIATAAGKPVDAFIAERIFTPLGITTWTWAKDKAGQVQTFYGLALSARDWAKVGLMLASGGVWNGKPVVPADWVRAISTPAEVNAHYGYLWWLRRRGPFFVHTAALAEGWAKAGFGSSAKLKGWVDVPFESREAFWIQAGGSLTPGEREALVELLPRLPNALEQKPQTTAGFYAEGWLGQKLVVYPEWNLVAVRQRRMSAGGGPEEAEKNGFGGFYRALEAAVVTNRAIP